MNWNVTKRHTHKIKKPKIHLLHFKINFTDVPSESETKCILFYDL